MRIKLLFLIFLSATSCCSFSLKMSEQQKSIMHLTNNSIKYWSDIWKTPFFKDNKEGGGAFCKDGTLIEYVFNSDNKRIITNVNFADVFCKQTTYRIKSDTLYIKECGYEFTLKIVKLTEDTLELKEIRTPSYFSGFGMPLGSVRLIYTKSKDQHTKAINDYEDYKEGPVKVHPLLLPKL